MGMVFAARRSEALGLAPAGVADRLEALLQRAGLPTELPDFPRRAYLDALRVDKKRRDVAHPLRRPARDRRGGDVPLLPEEILPRGRGAGRAPVQRRGRGALEVRQRRARSPASRRSLGADPGAPAFPALAEANRRAGRLDEAERVAREGLRRCPELLAGRVALALALLDLGRAARPAPSSSACSPRCPITRSRWASWRSTPAAPVPTPSTPSTTPRSTAPSRAPRPTSTRWSTRTRSPPRALRARTSTSPRALPGADARLAVRDAHGRRACSSARATARRGGRCAAQLSLRRDRTARARRRARRERACSPPSSAGSRTCGERDDELHLGAADDRGRVRRRRRRRADGQRRHRRSSRSRRSALPASFAGDAGGSATRSPPLGVEFGRILDEARKAADSLGGGAVEEACLSHGALLGAAARVDARPSSSSCSRRTATSARRAS